MSTPSSRLRFGRRRLTVLVAAALLALAALAGGAAHAQAAPGDRDPSFSRDGRVVRQFGEYSAARAVAPLADGRTYVAGYGSGVPGRPQPMLVVRLRDDGALDRSFGGSGIVRIVVPGRSATAYAVAVQPDARVLVAGEATVDGGQWEDALARLLPSGRLDPSFGNAGLVELPDAGGLLAMAVASDGRIATAGSRLQVFAADGTPDPRFGRLLPASGGPAWSVAFRPDGRIVVSGVDGDGPNAVWQYLPDGALDPGFGQGGVARFVWAGETASSGASLALLANGKLVLGGGVNGAFAAARLLANGRLDPTFGAGGRTTIPCGAGSCEANVYGQTIAVQADGKVVLGGRLHNRYFAGSAFALARLTPTGALDRSFGPNGRVATKFRGSEYDQVYAVAVRGDGKIVAVGESDTPSNWENRWAIARYLGQ